MYLLGLNAFHGDAAACLLKDGELVCAIEEERLTRIKHQAGFPVSAITLCLEQAGIGLDAVDHVAINRDPRAALWRKGLYLLTRIPDPALVKARLRNARSWAGVDESIEAAFPDQGFHARVHPVEHHLAHLASAFDPSPFDQALALSVDGFGDFASAAWGVADGRKIRIDARVHFPHSLGIFYQAMTQYLGFRNYGDEYKLMGLAAHGEARYTDQVGRLVRSRGDGAFRLDLRYFRHHREHVPYEWSDGSPVAGILFSEALSTLLGPPRRPDEELTQRHIDLAASVQQVYEAVFFRLVSALSRRYGVDRLVLAGGCAQNSLANGRLPEHTPIRELYVPPAAADAGGAVGAALVLERRLTGRRGGLRIREGGLGDAFGPARIKQVLDARAKEVADAGCVVEAIPRSAVLCERVASAIADGDVVGWFQGRMEWGPRALGHRSILADPRRGDMRERLNEKIKLRESFRPFAPSVLDAEVDQWFEGPIPGELATSFMACVRPVRDECRRQVPAITHVDGSGRVQAVNENDSPLYHELISAFARLTGVPMLLNTSFNENEPIVRTPEEALDCFLRTRMDGLVLGDVYVRRTGQGG